LTDQRTVIDKAAEIERLRAILREFGKLRRYNPNRNKRPARILTINAPAELLARIDEEIKK
jgi:hypothetical protein